MPWYWPKQKQSSSSITTNLDVFIRCQKYFVHLMWLPHPTRLMGVHDLWVSNPIYCSKVEKTPVLIYNELRVCLFNIYGVLTGQCDLPLGTSEFMNRLILMCRYFTKYTVPNTVRDRLKWLFFLVLNGNNARIFNRSWTIKGQVRGHIESTKHLRHWMNTLLARDRLERLVYYNLGQYKLIGIRQFMNSYRPSGRSHRTNITLHISNNTLLARYRLQRVYYSSSAHHLHMDIQQFMNPYMPVEKTLHIYNTLVIFGNTLLVRNRLK